MTSVYAYSSGQMEVAETKSVPDGTIIVYTGTPQKCRKVVMLGDLHPTMRHENGNRVWMVPGVAQAEREDDKLAALNAFVKHIARKL